MQDLAYILKGIAIVYVIQIQTLEGDTKLLLSEINGDNAWNYIVKRQKLGSPTKPKYRKKQRADGVRGMHPAVKVFNILDAKQILEFTKDKLHFLSSNYQDKMQIRNADGASAIKDFPNDFAIFNQ